MKPCTLEMYPSETEQNLAGPSPSTKYQTDQLMIGTIESQTQSLMHILELFYRYYNCNWGRQREKANCMMT